MDTFKQRIRKYARFMRLLLANNIYIYIYIYIYQKETRI